MELARLAERALAEIDSADDLAALDKVRVGLLGKSGLITAELKSLGKLAPEQRKTAGQAVNKVKSELAEAIEDRRAALADVALARELVAETVDVSLPARTAAGSGSLHPVTRVLRRITDIFTGNGFQVRYGPEIEDDHHNFTALNFPENHPARAMHDTFFFPDGRLLRTHTSPVQIRALLADGVPIRIIAPGRVYRCDSDQTHTPMFHQVEGLVVAERVTFANLKAVLHQFVEQFFERDAKLRFRPSYFPFTEPSAEVDVLSSEGRWLEILGCGMVHRNVLEGAGVDPDRYSGYAFGMGVERLAMLRYNVPDLRLFFENDLRFLSQFAR
ncbi:MAG: phenylalanine--tRNA ligase subunit alpha [Pseudomonadota bacterium]